MTVHFMGFCCCFARLPGLAVLLVTLALEPGIARAVDNPGDHVPDSAHPVPAMILGSIDFPSSAIPAAHDRFIQGVLALHSFWYPVAREYFHQARELDPAFGMTYWGEAMTYDNPALIATVPESEEQAGAAVIKRLDELDQAGKLTWSELERGFADAVRQRFDLSLDLPSRRQRYAQAMHDQLLRFPDEDEVIVFHALSIMSLHEFNKELGEHVVSAAAPLEEVFMRNPDHPGVLHYLIHMYDTPTFAPMGLRAALLYARVAPDSSHAHHMPSHIFRHLGMWEQVIESNVRAYQVSVAWQQRTGQPVYMRDFHAFDWLLSAYLKLGRMEQAEKMLNELDEIENTIRDLGADPGAEFGSIARGIRLIYQHASRGLYEFKY